MRAILALALTTALAAPALAGPAVQLQIEIPPDIETLAPGERLDPVQVVGIDADGARVGLTGRPVRVTATAGDVVSVSPPYHWAFTAPREVDGATTVRLTARLDDDPKVRGTLAIRVQPVATYTSLLVLPRDTRLAAGAVTDVTLLGRRSDGAMVPVVDRRIEMTLDGPGRLEFVRLGTFRYHAPASLTDGDRSATLTAHFARDESVRGTAVVLLGSGAPAPPAARGDADDGGDEPAPAPPTDEGTGSGSADAGGTDGDGDEDDAGREGPRPERVTVVWPGGHLQVTGWHGRGEDDTTWTRRIRRMPEPGGEFVARHAWQRVRAVVLADDVTSLDATWKTTEGEVGADAVVLRAKRSKSGKLVGLIEARPPADGRPLIVTLRLVRPDDDAIEQPLTLRRRERKDGDDDGEPEPGGGERPDTE